ncbi:MAG: SDR family NAD(P)-dependent oxidoreductase, partial [Gemmataceae bacterium]
MRCDLNGTVSLVTGAARGIGQAIADRLAINDSTVYYTDLDAANARPAAAKTPNGRGLKLDVTDPSDIASVIRHITDTHGRLDLLVNNAGINTAGDRKPIDQYARDDWDRILAVDLTAVYELSKAAAAVMRAQGRGRIVNIASIAGLVPLRLQSAYVVAKAGVVNLTKSMALELGPHGILVNGIAPGSILTVGTRQLFYGEGGEYKEAARRMLDH